MSTYLILVDELLFTNRLAGETEDEETSGSLLGNYFLLVLSQCFTFGLAPTDLYP